MTKKEFAKEYQRYDNLLWERFMKTTDDPFEGFHRPLVLRFGTPLHDEYDHAHAMGFVKALIRLDLTDG